MPENLVSRDGFSRPVLRQPAHLHTQADYVACLRDSSRLPRRRPIMKPPNAIGSVPSLSGHANVYRWRSLPRVRRHRATVNLKVVPNECCLVRSSWTKCPRPIVRSGVNSYLTMELADALDCNILLGCTPQK